MKLAGVAIPILSLCSCRVASSQQDGRVADSTCGPIRLYAGRAASLAWAGDQSAANYHSQDSGSHLYYLTASRQDSRLVKISVSHASSFHHITKQSTESDQQIEIRRQFYGHVTCADPERAELGRFRDDCWGRTGR